MQSKQVLDRWKELILKQKESKTEVSAFCREEKITPAQFYYYRVKFFPETKTSKKLIPIKIKSEPKIIIKTQASLILVMDDARLELPNDYPVEKLIKILMNLG